MLSGSIVALVTPMDTDGAINYSELGHLIEYHIESGTQGLVIAGTTGESATLEHEEHIELIARSQEFADGRCPIIAGTGSNSTQQTLNLSKAVDRLDVAGFLVVTPYYNKPTQEGMYRHFSAVADAVSAPVILYNVPGRTAVDLLPETVTRLAGHANIAGVKEASADLSRVTRIREGAGPEFTLLSGDDATCREFMLLGGNGVISVTANVAPAAMRRLCDAAIAGDGPAARGIDADLGQLHAALFVESNPIPVKWAVHEMGLISEGIRMPLTPLETAHEATVRSAMRRAGIETLAA
jgi:4-hydroxy-tetrahydrodipicolinate synthase